MLVSLSDMKTYLGETTTDYDDFLTQQITVISDSIEAYCMRKFNSTSYVQTFYKEDIIQRGYVIDELTCYQFPIISVASVVEKYDDGADTGVAVTDYRFHAGTAKIIKKKYTGTFFCRDLVEVTYTAGYAEVPAPITQAVYSLVQQNYNKKKNGIDINFGSDVQSVAIPGVINIQYDYTLQNNEKSSTMGMILGSWTNVLDIYRSERAVVGDIRLAYNVG